MPEPEQSVDATTGEEFAPSLLMSGPTEQTTPDLMETLAKVRDALAAQEARLQAIENHFKQVLHVDLAA